MPEYPDITIYIERLQFFLQDQKINNFRIKNPFLLRTSEPSINSIVDKKITGFERIGKRVVFVFTDNLYLILHFYFE